MGHQAPYKCTECGEVQPREDLIAKKVSFVTLGSKGTTIKSRTPHWLCFKCLKGDKDWNLVQYDSPGLRTVEQEAELNTPDLTKKFEEKRAASDGQ
ncbi:hypothetical protein AB0F25_30695 [Streptomyces wedmorensis]|uniref:hypothetical protein n=1 Tax=Streptomyces wedmorensis TaxID=43759 RepID=UPI00342E0C01